MQFWNGTSDTETLLALFENFGLEESLKLINGMFSFAVLDSMERKLHLCRDRFGEKPLYYGLNNGVLFLDPSQNLLRYILNGDQKICSKGLNQYFVKGYIGERYSIYKGIYKLLPANFISIDLQNINLTNYKTYWRLEK